MKTVKRLAFITLSLAFFIGIHSTVQAGTPVSLYDLSYDSIGSISAANLEFDLWWVGTDGMPVGDGLPDGMIEAPFPNLRDIIVSPLNDGPDKGLLFQAMNSALSVAEGEYIHLLLGFHVFTKGDLLIKDNSLNIIDPQLVPADQTSNLGIRISETIKDSPGSDGKVLGTKLAEYIWVEGVETINLFDSVNFAPKDEIFVTKDILIWKTLENETVNLVSFEQRFSRTSPNPEPATMLLLGTGLVGVAGVARRKKKNQT